MPILFQINVCLNFSTGKIVQQIGEKAIEHGWESWIAFSGRDPYMPSKSHTIRVGSFFDACVHYAGQRLFDREGLGSVVATKKLVSKLRDIKPDIVVLHVIHDHWLNYPILFEYLASIQVPVVWVQHDCWSFTGGCMYFDMINCEQWKTGCRKCPENRSLVNRAIFNFKKKQECLGKIKSLTFVAVSDWLADLLRSSVQGFRPVITIHNGCDIVNYNLTEEKKQNVKGTTKTRLLGVAGVWAPRKGLEDFIKLRKILPYEEFEITLLGLTDKQITQLPPHIMGLKRTQNEKELAQLYSDADLYLNPTYSDNFPTTNIESLASGTPVVTYNTGGSPEAVDEYTGRVIPQGDLEALVKEIYALREKPLAPLNCRQRAVKLFDKNKCFEKYIELFNDLNNNKNEENL